MHLNREQRLQVFFLFIYKLHILFKIYTRTDKKYVEDINYSTLLFLTFISNSNNLKIDLFLQKNTYSLRIGVFEYIFYS